MPRVAAQARRRSYVGHRRAGASRQDLADALPSSIAACCCWSALARDGGRAGAASSARGCGCCRWRVALARGGDHVRRAVAAGGAADDGLDRGAAGADRPGGRLRDPVPGARRRGSERRRRRRRRGRVAARRCRRSPPPALATAAGFLVLLLSPVPMVRGFGVLLVVGIAIALACALTRGHRGAGARSRDGRARARAAARALGARVAGDGCRAHPARARGARRLGAAARWRALRRRAARARGACSRSALVAGRRCGLGARHADRGRAPTSSELVPQDLPALRDLDALQKATGVAGEIDVRRRRATTSPTRRWSRG